jgi:lysophospholipase L1-like esterase
VPACSALEPAKIAALATCGTNVVKTPVPEIEDPTRSLAPFFDRLAELERGTATRPVRIAIYGDSNLTSDFLPGHLRRLLQARYGDAGHGWVSLSKPWGSYRHEDVTHAGFWPMFKLYAPTTHLVPDRQYGFANMAAQSSEIGAAAWAGTTKNAKSKVGQSVSRFELHYLKQPRGGSFTVQIDKKDVRSVETRASAFEAGIETFDVDDGAHELRCVVRGDGPVRLFGTSLDRSPAAGGSKAGIQIDSLGAGALNYQRLTWVANDTRRVQLARRAYDAIFIWLGMNVMFVPPNREWTKEVITELRTALPSVPILLLGPSDTVREGEKKSDPRIVAVAKQIREVAAETGVAFWDFREAMGGDGSIIDFTRRGLTGEDHIHFGPEGSHLMGDRLLCALSSAFSAHFGDHPNAGCPQPLPQASP